MLKWKTFLITAFIAGMQGLLLLSPIYSQTAASATALPASSYHPRDLFSALPLLPAGNPYRASTGEPGPAYWQNRADYTIDATLDDRRHAIHAIMVITYTNNSPHSLPYIWLQLDQDAFKAHSRGIDAGLFTDSNGAKGNQHFEGGYSFQSLTCNAVPVKFLVNDTRMQVFLPQPMKPGASLELHIAYSYALPRYFYNADFGVNRTDILPTPDGDIYSIAQWYPRLCVLDDVEGWNTLPYLGNGEFYLEYGDFRVNITLPSSYIVSASGELTNPEQVLTTSQLQRWKQAHASEKKVFIRSSEEIKDPSSRPSAPTCTWKFRMQNTRDFAWTASKSFIWEALRINLPEGKTALGESLYPPGSKTPDSWERSSEYVKFTIEYFSRQWLPYPYPCAVNVASNLSGMEYPGIVFCGPDRSGNSFWGVTNHELGHTWFPMIVGSNERKYAWMDEGFNIFIDHFASQSFNHGEFEGYRIWDGYEYELYADSLPPILTRPDGTKGNKVFPIQYLKTAYLLWLLREQIVGPERFDYALQKYIRDWAYKHPTPWDFFRSINSSVGEDLGWFWKQGFLESYKLDQAISGIRYASLSASSTIPASAPLSSLPASASTPPAPPRAMSASTPPAPGEVLVDIENLNQAAMPLIVEITTARGVKIRYRLPVEIWEADHRYTLKTGLSEPVSEVVIDPDKIFPDTDRSNNRWSR